MRVLFAMSACVLLCACAPVQQIERVPEVNVRTTDAFAQTKSFLYERSIRRGNVGDSTMTIEGGLACVPHVEAKATSSQNALTDQDYENIFQEEFEHAGIRIARTVGSGDLFTDKKDIPADYRIAGVITRPKMNVCFPMAGFGNYTSGKGEASMTVEWQVYSNQQRAVVYSTTQKGYAKLENSTANPGRELWHQAFARAVRGLLVDGGFLGLVSAGSGPVASRN